MERRQHLPDVLVGDSCRSDRNAGGRGRDVNMRRRQGRAIGTRSTLSLTCAGNLGTGMPLAPFEEGIVNAEAPGRLS
jgi:hypothetical protein